MGTRALRAGDWLLAIAAALFGITLALPWLRLTQTLDEAMAANFDMRPKTAEELLYGTDTIRAIGTTEMLIGLLCMTAAAAWVLAPAFTRHRVRRPLARRAVTVVLLAYPAVQTPLLVWNTWVADNFWSPTVFAWVSAGIALAALALAIAQYRAESRRREYQELANILAETLQRTGRG